MSSKTCRSKYPSDPNPLSKLGVTWEPTEAERAYNEGRSTQVPVNPVVRVKGRFSRRLRDGNLELMLERYTISSGVAGSPEAFWAAEPGVVEEDWYVVKALAAIVAVDAAPFRLVFGGGTALSRAHRLIRRMSDDIDPKITSDERPERPARFPR